MNIKIKDIGLIREANIELNGLTVIAGENDTGKSTIGKLLFALIKSNNITRHFSPGKKKQALATRLNLVFDANVISNSVDNGFVEMMDNGKNITKVILKDKNFVEKYDVNEEKRKFYDVTLFQSPIIFDLTNFFNSVSRLRERKKFEYNLEFDIKYPYILWDIYDKISKDNIFKYSKEITKITKNIEDIIAGSFISDAGKFYYTKVYDGKMEKIEMFNTAMGIKSFGIILLLNKNRYLGSKYLFIMDEPEVHLHPKWQLVMAKIIVNLVKNRVKVLVNSHSPYMIEALRRYSEIEEIDNKTNFYLAEGGFIDKVKSSNSDTLAKIYEKLSEPYDIFEDMDAKRMEKVING